jgi:thiol-disulfide isomerase/thioredoxin
MDEQPRSISIVLLTQQQCAFCDQAKELLDRLAAEYPLSVTALDFGTAEGQALAERSGLLFPPGILLDGEAFSYGRPSERKLRRRIEELLQVPSRSA